MYCTKESDPIRELDPEIEGASEYFGAKRRLSLKISGSLKYHV